MDSIDRAYRVLELEPGTSMTEVNQSYKDLVFIWHPDRIPSDRQRLREKAEAKLKQLNEARSFLRSQCRDGKIPASDGAKSGAKPSTRETADAKNGRSRGVYQPGDDSTYRPYSRAYQSAANANGSDSGSPNGSKSQSRSYRPPYEAYRRAAASGYSGSSNSYADSYRSPYPPAGYPSSQWPRREQAAQPAANGSASDPTGQGASSSADAKTGSVAGDRNSTPASQTTRSAYGQSSSVSQPARDKRNPDLSGADLKGANLKEKDFSGRNLSNANLAGADLSDTFMHKVNLNRANLRKARLFRANLLQADLSHADLSGADLIGADLSGADLSGADLSGAKVGYGDKIMVKLLGAKLTGTIMPNGRIHE